MKFDFDPNNHNFWGAIGSGFAAIAAYFRFKTKKGTINMEQVGIKETKEALDGLFTIGKEIAKVGKDGLQVKDAATIAEDLIQDPSFKAKLTAAIEGIGKVPAEIKDIDFAEGIELGKFGYDGVKSIIDELKK